MILCKRRFAFFLKGGGGLGVKWRLEPKQLKWYTLFLASFQVQKLDGSWLVGEVSEEIYLKTFHSSVLKMLKCWKIAIDDALVMFSPICIVTSPTTEQ